MHTPSGCLLCRRWRNSPSLQCPISSRPHPPGPDQWSLPVRHEQEEEWLIKRNVTEPTGKAIEHSNGSAFHSTPAGVPHVSMQATPHHAHPLTPSTYIHIGPVLLAVQEPHHGLDFALLWGPPIRLLVAHFVQTFARCFQLTGPT